MLLPCVEPVCIHAFLKANPRKNLQIKFMMYMMFRYVEPMCVCAFPKLKLRTDL